MKVFIVVPTIRENLIKEFLSAWEKEFSEHTVIVVEDNPEKSFDINYNNVLHFSWKEIDEEMQDKSRIIPRRTDCVRSYGYYKAYQLGADVIITLDDDCFPDSDNFVQKHLERLNFGEENIWENSLENIIPRGVPYFNQTRRNVAYLNHGLWNGVPDYDATTQLASERNKIIHEWKNKTIPKGKYFPMCGMNIAFKRELTPAMYFLLMGKNYEFDRFGDIWCGVISKKICDRLNFAVNSGEPAILHKRASNVWANLKKETPGMPINEDFWSVIDSIDLQGKNVKECYNEIIEGITFEGEYWVKLKEAMKIWLELFDQ